MFGALSKYSAFFTILIHLTEIRCCSLSTSEILSRVSEDPDYKKDPCYIEWQSSERRKSNEEWTRIQEDRNRIEANYQLYLYYNKQREEQAQAIQERKEMQRKRESIVLRGLLVFFVVMAGIFGCVVCVSRTQMCSSPANTRQSNSSSGGENRVSFIFAAANNPRIHNIRRNQRASISSTNNGIDNSTNLIPPPPQQQPETNIPMIPRDTTRRRNSLPSYEDAVGMPSAPSKA